MWIRIGAMRARTVAWNDRGYRSRVPGTEQIAERTETPAGEPESPPARPLRIIFAVERGALLRFPLLIPALAERGHEVHIAFALGGEWRTERPPELPPRTQQLVDELCARYPNVHYTYAP